MCFGGGERWEKDNKHFFDQLTMQHVEIIKETIIFDQYIITSEESYIGGNSFVKKCKDTLGGGGELAAKFHNCTDLYYREVGIAQKIRHSNVVRLLEAFEPDPENEPHPYAVSFWQCGDHSLEEFGRYIRPLELNLAKAIATDIINGLLAFAGQDIVHCDLKPQNVMFFRDPSSHDRWKLIDFDSACFIGEPVSRGTLDFCAPEMLRSQPAATSMDVFSLGRLIYWMFIRDNCWLWNKNDYFIEDEEKEKLLLMDEPLDICNQLSHEATILLIKSLTDKSPTLRKSLPDLLNSSYFSGNLHTKMISSSRSISDSLSIYPESIASSEFSSICPLSPPLQPFSPPRQQQSQDEQLIYPLQNSGSGGSGKIINPRTKRVDNSVGMVLEKKFIMLKSSRRNQSIITWLGYMPKMDCKVSIRFYEEKSEFERTIKSLKQLKHWKQKNILQINFALPAKYDSTYYPFSILVFDDAQIVLKNIVEQYRYKDNKYHSQLAAQTKWEAMKAILNGLKACHQYGIVCVDLNPYGIVRHHYSYTDPGVWKLSRFERSASVGEEVLLYKSSWASPEVAMAMKERRSLLANVELDMIGVGYLIYYLVAHVPFWNNVQDEMSVLCNNQEFDLTKMMIPNAKTRKIVAQLLRKDPNERMTLRDLIKSPLTTDIRLME